MKLGELLLGLVLGIVSSVGAWWAVALRLSPKYEVSSLNAVRDSKVPCGYRYRIKVRNLRRRSALTEVGLHARVVIRGLNADLPLNYYSMAVPVGSGSVFPVLERRRKTAGPLDNERIYTLDIHHLDGDSFRRMPPEVQERVTNGTITLEELLGLGDRGVVRLAVSGTHDRSGFKRTQTFKFDKQVEGEFNRGSVDITRYPT